MNENTPTPVNPFAGMQMQNINEGAVSIESSRAIAEAKSKLLLAKTFPRDTNAAYMQMMTACSRMALAEKALYSYPRGKTTVTGPTIRLAEELARCWGNIDFSWKELSQDEDGSEIQVYCWDMETNTISSQTFVVPHYREADGIKKKLTSARDIYEHCANMAGRRMRARILAVIPPYLVEEAIEQCKKTLEGNNGTPIEDRIKKMLLAFQKLGVKQELIEKRLGRAVDTMTPQDIAEYITIFNSLKDGNTVAADWFDVKAGASRAADVAEKIAGGKTDGK